MTENSIVPVDNQTTNLIISTSLDAQPVKLSDILDEFGFNAPQIPAKDLIGRTFTIYRGRTFMSTYNDNSHAWFIFGVTLDDNNSFSSIIGGHACVDVLDAWALSGRQEPLTVKLEWVEKGKYRGYYKFS